MMIIPTSVFPENLFSSNVDGLLLGLICNFLDKTNPVELVLIKLTSPSSGVGACSK